MAVRLLVAANVTGQRQIDNLQRSITRMGGLARGLQIALAGAFAVAAVRGFSNAITEASDTIVGIQNQLRAAGVDTADLADAQADVVRLAEQTRSSLEATGGLYARVLRSTRELGVSQEEGLTIARAFQETLALSGASAQEAAAASLQFGQALASGRLQGDELRSILENNSFFAQRFAEALGVGVGQLREMGAQGELTSELLAEVALRIAPDVNRQFAQLTPTFAQAGNVLQNRLTLATAGFADEIRATIGDVVQLASTIGNTLAAGITRAGRVISAMRENVEGLRVILIATAATITTVLIPSIIRLSTVILTRLAGAVLFLIGPIGSLIAAVAAVGTIGVLAFDEIVVAIGAAADRAALLPDQFLNLFDRLAAQAVIGGAAFVEGFVANLDDIGEAIIDFVLFPLNQAIDLANAAGANLSRLSVDIPEATVDIDTSAAEADLIRLTEDAAVIAMSVDAANAAVGDSVAAIGDVVTESFNQATMAVSGLLGALNQPIDETITPAAEMAIDATVPEMTPDMGGFLDDLGAAFQFDDDEVADIGLNFRRNLETGLSQALNEGDFSGLGNVFLSSFTMSVNDQLAEGLSNVFSDLFTDLTSQAEGEGSGIIGAFQGIFDSISGLFSGGGGGGFGGLLSAGLGLFGFADGGVIPGPRGAAMPVIAHGGEVVLNREQQERLLNGGAGGPMTINQTLQVTGDVTEATRRAVREMGDDITNQVQSGFTERGLLGG